MRRAINQFNWERAFEKKMWMTKFQSFIKQL